MLQSESPLIEPIYAQEEPSQAIDLGAVAVGFAHGGQAYKSQGHVSVRFTPDDRLYIEISTDDKNPLLALQVFLDDNWDGKLKLTERNVTLDVILTAGGSDDGTLAFRPKTSVITVTLPADNMAFAAFHLFNFPELFGAEDYVLATGQDEPRFGTRLCGRVILKADGWNITIAATDNTADLCKALRRDGGFVITHMGKIERDDGSLFSSEQLTDLLGCLHHFLSFALGRWAEVSLPVGFDQNGQRVFEQWGTPMMACGPWNGSCSWFDSDQGQLLSEVFPGFVDLWTDATWNNTVRAALYWYLAANERGTGVGVDTGLILAQIALERLAWTYCVQHRRMISADAFEPRGLSAAHKLRLLASALDIPLDLPADLPALHGRRGRKWQDGMGAITSIRNSVVHPEPKDKRPDGSYVEGWKLALWYLDMVFLRLCGHEGSYANRLESRWKGQVESVPWAAPAED